jgi:hypothetical protein
MHLLLIARKQKTKKFNDTWVIKFFLVSLVARYPCFGCGVAFSIQEIKTLLQILIELIVFPTGCLRILHTVKWNEVQI